MIALGITTLNKLLRNITWNFMFFLPFLRSMYFSKSFKHCFNNLLLNGFSHGFEWGNMNKKRVAFSLVTILKFESVLYSFGSFYIFIKHIVAYIFTSVFWLFYLHSLYHQMVQHTLKIQLCEEAIFDAIFVTYWLVNWLVLSLIRNSKVSYIFCSIFKTKTSSWVSNS